MSYTICKYLLAILACIPVFIAGYILFERILRSITNIEMKKVEIKKAAREEAQRKKRFESEYRRLHGKI